MRILVKNPTLLSPHGSCPWKPPSEIFIVPGKMIAGLLATQSDPAKFIASVVEVVTVPCGECGVTFAYKTFEVLK